MWLRTLPAVRSPYLPSTPTQNGVRFSENLWWMVLWNSLDRWSLPATGSSDALIHERLSIEFLSISQALPRPVLLNYVLDVFVMMVLHQMLCSLRSKHWDVSTLTDKSWNYLCSQVFVFRERFAGKLRPILLVLYSVQIDDGRALFNR